MADTLQDTLNEREKAHEAKFKLDQEQQFKARARRNKLLGLWAAEKIGLGASESEGYAKEMVIAGMDSPGDEALIGKITDDLDKHGVEIAEEQITAEIERLYALALEQLADEYPDSLDSDHAPVGG